MRMNSIAEYQLRLKNPRNDVWGKTLEEDTPESLRKIFIDPFQRESSRNKSTSAPRTYKVGNDVVSIDPNTGESKMVFKAPAKALVDPFFNKDRDAKYKAVEAASKAVLDAGTPLKRQAAYKELEAAKEALAEFRNAPRPAAAVPAAAAAALESPIRKPLENYGFISNTDDSQGIPLGENVFQTKISKFRNAPRPAAAAAAAAAAPAGQSVPQGMIQQGNIDLNTRPVVQNKDGTVSTVRSIGINVNGREVLIPTVSEDGRVMSNAEAVDTFKKTGRHLGMFGSEQDATRYAKQLHVQQAGQLDPSGAVQPKQQYVAAPAAAALESPIRKPLENYGFIGDPNNVRESPDGPENVFGTNKKYSRNGRIPKELMLQLIDRAKGDRDKAAKFAIQAGYSLE